MSASYLEQSFDVWLRQEGLPPWEREYRFSTSRRWRIDFAWPKLLVGVEINGLVWGRPGGHQTVKGIIAAAEKHEALMMEGWRVLQVPGPWVAEGNRSIWRPRTMDTLKLLLGRGEE